MLHYKIYNHSEKAEWVTFIHGAGGSSNIWFKQIKAFRLNYNVLLIDLRGHGLSKKVDNNNNNKKYSFAYLSQDVVNVLEFLKIKESHFIGISLGTIIIRKIEELRPDLVSSMIMAGAILKLNFISQLLMRLGYVLHRVLPYMTIYKLFAMIILPRENHRNSRNIFIREAKKLYRKEFIRWYRLTSEVNSILRSYRQTKLETPLLFVMGQEDYMFLSSVKVFVRKNLFAKLNVIPDCGHIVNVESADLFNTICLGFLTKNKKYKTDSSAELSSPKI